MLGTIVNSVAIVAGSFVGLLLKNGIKENYEELIVNVLALCTIFIGASSAFQGLENPTTLPLLFIVSITVGSIFGEWLKIEEKLENLGNYMQEKLKKPDSNISQGFVTASILFCVGAMAILGSIESGTTGDHTNLYIKSILDCVMAIILTSSLGIGVMISAVSVFIYQGSITLMAGFIQPYLTPEILNEISIIGGILIAAIGINMMGIKKLKVGNMLPSVLGPVVYFIIVGLF